MKANFTGGIAVDWEVHDYALTKGVAFIPSHDGFPDRVAKSFSVIMPVANLSHVTIADVGHGSPRVHAWDKPGNLDETLANLALISAAPRMLRALVSAASPLKHYTDAELDQLAKTASGRGEIAPDVAALHIEIRAAIAHATRVIAYDPNAPA